MRRRIYTARPGERLELRLDDGTVVRGARITVRRYGRWHPKSLWLRLRHNHDRT